MGAISIPKRMMIFADGENLVARYQAMIVAGRTPHEGVVHEKDVFVWNNRFGYDGNHTVWRATYYCTARGDEDALAAHADRLRTVKVLSPGYSTYQHEHPWQAQVFKKHANQRQSKGVDIRLAVDVLAHVAKKNTDSVLICTGDGDFVPLVHECIHQGQQVLVAAFSNGLSSKLKCAADSFIDLDRVFFKSAA